MTGRVKKGSIVEVEEEDGKRKNGVVLGGKREG